MGHAIDGERNTIGYFLIIYLQLSQMPNDPTSEVDARFAPFNVGTRNFVLSQTFKDEHDF
jgi:hypothetical protein